MRRFIEAVFKYTGAKRINVVAHSMGVTLTRRVLKGGWMNATGDESIYVGSALSSKVNTFIAIAGFNWGWLPCLNETNHRIWNTCNDKNGFFPGYSVGNEGMSEFL